jgi:DNA helicase-2/ATP-dependent DNA helicase PcrA
MSWFDTQAQVNYEDKYNKDAEPIEIGQTIVHTTFGQGYVVDRYGDFIEVIFKAPYGKKTIIWNHVNVKRVVV